MILWAASGAALGAGARAALYALLPLYGTLAANALGSVLIGVLAAQPLSTRMRAFAMTGFCGGFTTFSLFGLETLTLLQARAYVGMTLYLGATLLLSLGGAALGLRFGKGLHLARNTPPG